MSRDPSQPQPQLVKAIMSQDGNETRDAAHHILQSYLLLYSQGRWEEWIALWADDGVLEFPFAPAGRKARYAGRLEILAYMQATSVRMGERIQVEGLHSLQIHPLLDPTGMCVEMSVRGRVIADGAPYLQKYVAFIQIRDGELTLYREYWNPLVSADANGGRDVWAAAFGMPEDRTDAAFEGA